MVCKVSQRGRVEYQHKRFMTSKVILFRHYGFLEGVAEVMVESRDLMGPIPKLL